MARLEFLGATGTVTGSKHLVEARGQRILVDCGLYQGLKALRLRNRERLPVDRASIDWVVLTHGHIDHTGYRPRLIKDGLEAPVLATRATADLLKLLLRGRISGARNSRPSAAGRRDVYRIYGEENRCSFPFEQSA